MGQTAAMESASARLLEAEKRVSEAVTARALEAERRGVDLLRVPLHQSSEKPRRCSG